MLASAQMYLLIRYMTFMTELVFLFLKSRPECARDLMVRASFYELHMIDITNKLIDYSTQHEVLVA